MKSYVKESIDKMIQKEKVYKKIDFEKDICKEKSDLYFINEDGELQFICGTPKNLLDYNGYFFDDPEECSSRTSLEFKPVEVFYEDSKFYHSRYIFDNLIEEYDIIYFKFDNDSLKKNESFNLYLFDKLYLEAHKKVKMTKDMLRNGQYFELNLNNINARCRYCLNKEELSYTDYNKSINYSKNNKYILDLSKRKIFINDTLINNFIKLDFKNILNNICLLYKYPNFKERIVSIKREDLILGKRQGVIYLKPIQLEEDVKLEVIYQGDIKVEVHSYIDNKWTVLNKKQILKKGNILNVRLILSTCDKLSKVYFGVHQGESNGH